MESLDAGVTCVVDHAHMNYGPGYCMLLLFLVVFSQLSYDSQSFRYPRRALVNCVLANARLHARPPSVALSSS